MTREKDLLHLQPRKKCKEIVIITYIRSQNGTMLLQGTNFLLQKMNLLHRLIQKHRLFLLRQRLLR